MLFQFLPQIHGPKGIGALILNLKSDFINPISHGGLQEQDIRSGTVPVLTVGLSEALHLSHVEHSKNKKYLLD